jgi:hypothetical protein
MVVNTSLCLYCSVVVHVFISLIVLECYFSDVSEIVGGNCHLLLDELGQP